MASPQTQNYIQRVSSIARQVLAVTALVFAALTQGLQGIKLPATASAVLGVFGTLILALEHYVADPSTGTPPSPPGASPAPPAP